jgi:hypothetical protein
MYTASSQSKDVEGNIATKNEEHCHEINKGSMQTPPTDPLQNP